MAVLMDAVLWCVTPPSDLEMESCGVGAVHEGGGVGGGARAGRCAPKQLLT